MTHRLEVQTLYETRFAEKTLQSQDIDIELQATSSNPNPEPGCKPPPSTTLAFTLAFALTFTFTPTTNPRPKLHPKLHPNPQPNPQPNQGARRRLRAARKGSLSREELKKRSRALEAVKTALESKEAVVSTKLSKLEANLGQVVISIDDQRSFRKQHRQAPLASSGSPMQPKYNPSTTQV